MPSALIQAACLGTTCLEQGVSPPTRAYLLCVMQAGNSSRTSCFVGNYFGALGVPLVWQLPTANKHLTSEVRSGKIVWISD